MRRSWASLGAWLWAASLLPAGEAAAPAPSRRAVPAPVPGTWVEWEVSHPSSAEGQAGTTGSGGSRSAAPAVPVTARCRLVLEGVSGTTVRLRLETDLGGGTVSAYRGDFVLDPPGGGDRPSDMLAAPHVETVRYPVDGRELDVHTAVWTLESAAGPQPVTRGMAEALPFGPVFFEAGDLRIKAMAFGRTPPGETPAPPEAGAPPTKESAP